MAAMAGSGAGADRNSKVYFKGQKMVTVSGDTATIIDFGAQTVTTVNHAQKTVSVKKFGEIAGAATANTEVSFDVKETGQKKVINGFNASETVITMGMDMETGRGAASNMPAMKMQMEMDLWVSPDVPGAAEMRAFYRKNAAGFPWAALTGGGNPSLQKAMAQMERKLAELDGVVVERVVRVRAAGGAQSPQMAQMPQMTPAQQAQMQAAMAKMQEMAKQGGPAGAAAQQAMQSMGGMARGGAAAGVGGLLIEMTIDTSGYSGANVPESVFAVPDGYKQVP